MGNQTEICRKHTHKGKLMPIQIDIKRLNVFRVQESGTTAVGRFIDADLIKWL